MSHPLDGCQQFSISVRVPKFGTLEKAGSISDWVFAVVEHLGKHISNSVGRSIRGKYEGAIEVRVGKQWRGGGCFLKGFEPYFLGRTPFVYLVWCPDFPFLFFLMGGLSFEHIVEGLSQSGVVRDVSLKVPYETQKGLQLSYVFVGAGEFSNPASTEYIVVV